MAEQTRNFRVPVWTGIFEHYGRIKDAIWLYLWYVDRTTREVTTDDGRRVGIVLGGMPIRDSDPARSLGCSDVTTRGWRRRLAREGYILQTRAPVGYVIRVQKSKKWRADGAVKKYRSERYKSTDQTGMNLPITGKVIGTNRTSELQDRTDPYRQYKTGQTAAAAVRRLDAWKAVGLKGPVGHRGFRTAWEKRFPDWEQSESLPEFLERFVQDCQDGGVAVPGAFYEAKHELERSPDRQSPDAGERDWIGRVPTLADIVPEGL